MRERLWDNVQNTKFKSSYLCELSQNAYFYGNIYSFVLAFGASGSVAAWALWDALPYVWATIVGLSQLLHVAKPHIPFLKHEREYMELCFKYQLLHLKYEKLWFRYEKGTEDPECMEQEFYELRDDEIEFLDKMKHIHVPSFKGLKKQISAEVNAELNRTFS